MLSLRRPGYRRRRKCHAVNRAVHSKRIYVTPLVTVAVPDKVSSPVSASDQLATIVLPCFSSRVASIECPGAFILTLHVAVVPTINIFGLVIVYSTLSGGIYAAPATLAKA